jgi:hypothetical protein
MPKPKLITPDSEKQVKFLLFYLEVARKSGKIIVMNERQEGST